jgi:RNA polymerase I-specific transcription initiation factor RRN3
MVIGQEGIDADSDESDDGEGLSDISSDAGDMDLAESPSDLPMNVEHIRDMVKKLDAILKLLFDHLHRRRSLATFDSQPLPLSSPPPGSHFHSPTVAELPPTPLPIEYSKTERLSQFHTLLSIFDRTILRTFRSRYTQFLLFWYSSLDAEFNDLFLGMLVSKALLEHDQPPVTRAAAASYIGSFVSRAQFIDRDGARRVAVVLCNYLRSALDALDVQSQSISLPNGESSVFYAISQAVFLIFCFRWRDLLEETDEDMDELLGRPKPGQKWMTELSVVQRLIISPLNPLKVRI